jgi:hypothetical protein
VASPVDPPPDPTARRPSTRRNANAPREEVRLDLPADYDADDALYTLAPPDPAGPDDRRRPASRSIVPRQGPADEPFSERWQFTLAQVLIANSMLAFVLALTHWMAPTLLAGILGLVAFGLFLFVTVYQPSQPGIYALVWILVLVYVVAASVALVDGG